MTKEQLLAAGFTEEQATNILKLHKEAIDGNYVPIHRFNEVNTELKTARTSLAERDKQIEGLKKFEGTAAELQAKIKELEDANKAADEKYKQELAAERKRNAVKLSLLDDAEGKPHDVEMVMSLFDLDTIEVDESGKIIKGFKEQCEAIRKDKAFLFESKTESGKPAGWKPAGTPPADGDKGGQPADPSVSFGKSLAQIKLGMMGIQPTNSETK
jgi:hypothetical protein